MKFKMPKIFTAMDAKSRVLIVIFALSGVVSFIVLANYLFGGRGQDIGTSRVPGAPSKVQSVPGSQLSPEYYRALMAANAQTAQQAQISGGSAVPTLVRLPPVAATSPANSAGCTIMCPSGETADVTDEINSLIKQGKIIEADAQSLIELANNNAPVSDMGGQLDNLVQQGKLPPDQARRLLEVYQKQYTNETIKGSAEMMDSFIKSGQLPLDVATNLLALQKNNTPAADYNAALDQMVQSGKILSQIAGQLADQYKQQQIKLTSAESVAELSRMAKKGVITEEVAKDLIDYQKRAAPVSQYQAEVSRLEAAGKITPATSAKLLAQYDKRSAEVSSNLLNKFISDATSDAAKEVTRLSETTKLSSEVTNKLGELAQSGASADDYRNNLTQLVQAGKLTTEDANDLMARYTRAQAAKARTTENIKSLVTQGTLTKEAADKLTSLQKQGVSAQEYQAAINDLTQAGSLSESDAAHLNNSYDNVVAAKTAMSNRLNDLVNRNVVSASEANQLVDLASKDATTEEYQQAVTNLANTSKLSQTDAQQLNANYQEVKKQQQTARTEVETLLQQGKLNKETVEYLTSLQKRHVSAKDYRDAVNDLLQSGQLSQNEATNLVNDYQKTLTAKQAAHDEVNKLSQDSASQTAANELSTVEQKIASREDVKDVLDGLIKSNKISDAQAKQINTAYAKLEEAQNTASNQVTSTANNGKLSATSASQLLDQQKAGVSSDNYQEAVNKLVQSGELTKEEASRMTQAYQAVEQAKLAANQALNSLKDAAHSSEEANNIETLHTQAEDTVNSLVNTGKISKEAASQLTSLQRQNSTLDEYQTTVNQLVNTNKLQKDDAEKMVKAYQSLQAARNSSDSSQSQRANNLANSDINQLTELQNQATASQEYQSKLADLVSRGKLSKEKAARLLSSFTDKQKIEATAKESVRHLLNQGKISTEAANRLLTMQKEGVSYAGYKNAVNSLVKKGQLSAADASNISQSYRDMQQNNRKVEQEVKSLQQQGKLSAQQAAQLLELQKKSADTAEYQTAVKAVVNSGRLSEEDANQLVANYQNLETNKKSLSRDLATTVEQGKLSADVQAQLAELSINNASLPDFQNAINQLVTSGKVSAADAQHLKEDYALLKAAEADLFNLVQGGKISKQSANQLLELQKKHVAAPEYQAALAKLVQEGSLAPEDAKHLAASYQKVKSLQEQSRRLTDMRNQNVPAQDYQNELARAVQQGVLTSEQADNLLKEFKGVAVSLAGTKPQAEINIPAGTNAFDGLSLGVEQQLTNPNMPISPADSLTATGAIKPVVAPAANTAEEALQEEAQQRQARIQEIASTMSGQAKSLVDSWKAPTMQHVGGTGDVQLQAQQTASAKATADAALAAKNAQASTGAPLIKAGTILFGVLDTAVNSDYPDTPVMVTIQQGKFRGAKLLGKLSLPQGQEKMSLSFNLMNRDDWDKSKTISAFAIDPETARTVMANEVDHHYLLRYGSVIASSFVTGYSNAIMSSGSVNSNNVTGTILTRPALDARDKLLVGIGQIGTTLGQQVQNNINTPPTVKIHAGVGVGILFMSDVVA